MESYVYVCVGALPSPKLCDSDPHPILEETAQKIEDSIDPPSPAPPLHL